MTQVEQISGKQHSYGLAFSLIGIGAVFCILAYMLFFKKDSTTNLTTPLDNTLTNTQQEGVGVNEGFTSLSQTGSFQKTDSPEEMLNIITQQSKEQLTRRQVANAQENFRPETLFMGIFKIFHGDAIILKK